MCVCTVASLPVRLCSSFFWQFLFTTVQLTHSLKTHTRKHVCLCTYVCVCVCVCVCFCYCSPSRLCFLINFDHTRAGFIHRFACVCVIMVPRYSSIHSDIISGRKQAIWTRDIWTDGRTDRPFYRDAWTPLWRDDYDTLIISRNAKTTGWGEKGKKYTSSPPPLPPPPLCELKEN